MSFFQILASVILLYFFITDAYRMNVIGTIESRMKTMKEDIDYLEDQIVELENELANFKQTLT